MNYFLHRLLRVAPDLTASSTKWVVVAEIFLSGWEGNPRADITA